MVRVGYGWADSVACGSEAGYRVCFVALSDLGDGKFKATFTVNGIQYSSTSVNIAEYYQRPQYATPPVVTSDWAAYIGGYSYRTDKAAFDVTITSMIVLGEAEVYLDGNLIGNTVGKSISLTGLTYGPHTLTMKASGFQDITREFIVPDTMNINMIMVKA